MDFETQNFENYSLGSSLTTFCLNLIKEIQNKTDKTINLLVQEIQVQDEVKTNLVIKKIQNEIDLQKLSANVLVKQEFNKLNKKIQAIEQNFEQELHKLKNHILFTLL
ncbi:15178_t:CDS:2, partial [Racocetra persica]